jgi:lipid II:glycine glycyltransferase (peptidoglycan interpeptide bridge formation enzyme)
LNLITLHKRIIKESAKAGKTWLKEIKQWRPRKPGSKEFELKSGPAKTNRHDRRARFARQLAEFSILAHEAYKAGKSKLQPTAHQMPKPYRLYRKPVTNAELLHGCSPAEKREVRQAIKEGDRELLIKFAFPGYV